MKMEEWEPAQEEEESYYVDSDTIDIFNWTIIKEFLIDFRDKYELSK